MHLSGRRQGPFNTAPPACEGVNGELATDPRLPVGLQLGTAAGDCKQHIPDEYPVCCCMHFDSCVYQTCLQCTRESRVKLSRMSEWPALPKHLPNSLAVS
jgi:hypothetical protein